MLVKRTPARKNKKQTKQEQKVKIKRRIVVGIKNLQGTKRNMTGKMKNDRE